MRLNLALIASVVAIVGIVAWGFTYHQIATERSSLNSELKTRIAGIAEDILQDSNMFGKEKIDTSYVRRILDSLDKRYILLGTAVFYGRDYVGSSAAVRPLLAQSMDYVSESVAADTSVSYFINENGTSVFQYIQPVQKDEHPGRGIIIYASAEYIDHIINSIRIRNFVRWFIQALLVSFISILIVRRGILSPIGKIVDWVKAARAGNIEQLRQRPPARFLAPLHKEIINIAEAMHEAKAAAEEEARLRTNAEAIWTPERLRAEMEQLLNGKRLIVVSNREPYMHIHEKKAIKCIIPASGMITAMEPLLKACGGLWIASGTGDADRETVDDHDRIQVPPETPAYTLRRIWQSKEEEDHFYYGFSNEGLWPLCHIAHTRPVFRNEDWHYYRQVNERFAQVVLEETADEDQPFILIQDYHFALLPELIKQHKPLARIAIFWHIPWPNPESFGICPWQKDILNGMLGADLIGFHTQYHCNNFLDTVNGALESRVLWDNHSVKMNGRTTFVKPFPISIAFTAKDFDQPAIPDRSVLEDLGVESRYIGIGVDRIDYTKGLAEKFLAIEDFLEKNPEYIGNFTFIQIGAPSRTLLKSYSDMMGMVENEANRINWRFRTKHWQPIVLLKRHHSHEEILPYYRLANFCMVTSLHDGMNLVAKEFVAARNNNDGTLILSRFAGAARELHGALVINPYDTGKMSEAIKTALEMDIEEQQQRMRLMRQIIMRHNIYAWAADLVHTMANIRG